MWLLCRVDGGQRACVSIYIHVYMGSSGRCFFRLFFCVRFFPLALELFPSHFLYISVALALWFLRISIYMYMTLFG